MSKDNAAGSSDAAVFRIIITREGFNYCPARFEITDKTESNSFPTANIKTMRATGEKAVCTKWFTLKDDGNEDGGFST